MSAFYKVSTALEQELLKHPDINVVTMGTLYEVDMDMQTIYGLAHINPESAEVHNSILKLTFTVYVMGNVDINKDNVRDLDTPTFRGNDNLHDVWNWTLDVVNGLYRSASKGDVFDKQVQVEGNPIATPFQARWGNLLAGWEMPITVQVPNTHPIC